jgi:ABC-type uncharacterized transport system permease subunit
MGRGKVSAPSSAVLLEAAQATFDEIIMFHLILVIQQSDFVLYIGANSKRASELSSNTLCVIIILSFFLHMHSFIHSFEFCLVRFWQNGKLQA